MSKALPTKWTGKEIGVTIGYGVLLLLAFFVGDCLGFFGPFMWIYGAAVAILIAAIPYFYIAAREQRYGTFTIVGVLFVLYGLLGGNMGNPPYLICTLIALICPDLIRMAMGYDSFLGTLVSFVVFAIGHIGPQLTIWLMPDWCYAQAAEEMNEAYAEALVHGHAGAGECILFVVVCIAAAVLGAYVAKALLRKPLTKYGMLAAPANGTSANA